VGTAGRQPSSALALALDSRSDCLVIIVPAYGAAARSSAPGSWIGRGSANAAASAPISSPHRTGSSSTML